MLYCVIKSFHHHIPVWKAGAAQRSIKIHTHTMEGFLPLWPITCIMCWIFNNFPPRLSSSNSGATDSRPCKYHLQPEVQFKPDDAPIWASLVAQTVKNPPVMRETWVQSLGWVVLLEEGMATHSSMFARRIPMDRNAWWATVHGVAKSWMLLSD